MRVFLVIFGLSAGIIVGSGVIAIFILVGVVPRMAHVSKTTSFIRLYETLLVVGAFMGGIIYLYDLHSLVLNISTIVKLKTIISGLAYGIFIGFLSSGLTEIMDYIPVVSRRLSLPSEYLKYVIISLLIGKVLGSFLGWIII